MKIETTTLANGEVELIVKRDSGDRIAAISVTHDGHSDDGETFAVQTSVRGLNADGEPIWLVSSERATVIDDADESDQEVADRFGELVAEMAERTGKSEQDVMYELARNYWDEVPPQ